MSGASWTPQYLKDFPDMPDSYSGMSGKYLRMNANENALEFTSTLQSAIILGMTDVRDYGAIGDGRWAGTGSILSGSASLTIAITKDILSSYGGFSSSDVGKSIAVAGAGIGGTVMYSTISTYISPTNVLLVDTAATTVAWVSGNDTPVVEVSWGTNNGDYIQAAIAASGFGGTVWLPPLNFYCGGKTLRTTAAQQSIVSAGFGVNLYFCGIALDHRLNCLSNLNVFGAEPYYGLELTQYTTGNYPQIQSVSAEYHRCMNMHIANKPYGIYNPTRMNNLRFFDIRITNCGTGVFVDHSNFSGDAGNYYFNMCFVYGCVKGFHVVKLGGLNLTSTKVFKCDTGLKFYITQAASDITTSGNSPIQGTYIGNSEIEDCATPISIDADAGVPTSKYMRRSKFIGGTVYTSSPTGLVLQKTRDIHFGGVLMLIPRLEISSSAYGVTLTDCDGGDLKAIVTGSGTDYTITGRKGGEGTAYIKTGDQLKLYNPANPSGKVI